jgi:hypothetical protein
MTTYIVHAWRNFKEFRVQRDELTFNDSASIIYDWLRDNT